VKHLYIVVVTPDEDGNSNAFGSIIGGGGCLITARAIAEEWSRKNPNKEFLVFQCVGSCVQEMVWKPIEQKPVNRDSDGVLYTPGTK